MKIKSSSGYHYKPNTKHHCLFHQCKSNTKETMEITAAAMNTTTPPIIGAAADCCAGTKENNNNWLFSFNYNNCKYFGYNLLSISVRKLRERSCSITVDSSYSEGVVCVRNESASSEALTHHLNRDHSPTLFLEFHSVVGDWPITLNAFYGTPGHSYTSGGNHGGSHNLWSSSGDCIEYCLIITFKQ